MMKHTHNDEVQEKQAEEKRSQDTYTHTHTHTHTYTRTRTHLMEAGVSEDTSPEAFGVDGPFVCRDRCASLMPLVC